jgi:hypothetical protein
LKKYIEDIVSDFLKPRLRLACICGDFRPDYPDPSFQYTRCDCGGWLSAVEMQKVKIENA